MPPDRRAAKLLHPTLISMQRRHYLGFADGLLLLAAAVVAYFPSLSNQWIWDDDDYITENRTLESAEGLWRIWSDIEATPQYYPLVHSGFWLERRLWGDVPDAEGQPGPNPFGYHLDNTLLHALGALLLWRVLRVLGMPGAWLAALLFAIHPVTVESVAWATERKNVLSGVFFFASALAWLRFARLGPGLNNPNNAEETDKPRWGPYALAYFWYVCALLSKSVTASLPAALALVLWWKKGRLPKRETWSLVLMLPMGLVSGLFTAYLERERVRAEGPYWDQSFLESNLIAAKSLWVYVEKIVWPLHLAFFYERWLPDTGDLLQWIYLLAAIGVVALLWILRRRIGRGPLVGALFFGGTLFPALGFLNVYPHRYSWVADHFQYLACIGILGILGAAAASTPLYKRDEDRTNGPLAGGWGWRAYVIPGLLAGVLIPLTWKQCAIYENEETLWTDTIEKTPSSYIAYSNLGALYFKQGQQAKGLQYYRKGLELDPEDPEGTFGPKTWEGKFGMSMMHLHLNNYPQTIQFARESLDIEPLDRAPEKEALSRLNIGAASVLLKDLNPAITELREAVRLDPSLAPAHAYLGEAYARQALTPVAIESLQNALRINSSELDALINLSWIYSSHSQQLYRKPKQALQLAQSACQLTNNSYAPALDALAAAQAANGNFRQATQTIGQALQILKSSSGMTDRQSLYRQKKPYRSELGLPPRS